MALEAIEGDVLGLTADARAGSQTTDTYGHRLGFIQDADLSQIERRGDLLKLIDRIPEFTEEKTDAGEIFSSTGELGRKQRPFNRLYENRVHYSTDFAELISSFQEMVDGIEPNGDTTRVVMRGLVSAEALREILQSPVRPNLEVALDVSEFTGDASWLIYLAKNSTERTQIVSTEEMIEATEKDKSIPTESPGRRIQRVIDQGYKFVDRLAEDQVDQVLSLWEETFGWSKTEVENLRRKLDAGDDGLWFSAVVDSEGNIITAATAEKLDIPGEHEDLSLVENTEWRTKDGHQRKGLMTATLDMLNAQILADLRLTEDDRLPLIYAECNFQSRSDWAGHGAGFEIPQRSIDGQLVPQLIIQNVNIGDNQPVPADKLRDFTFMYLSVGVINIDYSPQQVQNMLAAIL